MAEMSSRMPAVHSTRLHALVVPREHGAWGMLLVPLFTGALIGLQTSTRLTPLLLFACAALALFWLRTPVESLLGASPLRAHTREEKRYVSVVAVAVAVVAILALLGLLWRGQNPALLLIGAVCGLTFAAQAIARRMGRRYRMISQVIGAVGLTATAPAAYYVLTGNLDARAYALWFANWVFAGNQIHFVQLRLHASRAVDAEQKFAIGYRFFLGQIVMMGVIAAAWQVQLLPALAVAAFVPAVVRGWAWFFQKQRPLALHWLGITELLYGVTFGTLLISSFYIHL